MAESDVLADAEPCVCGTCFTCLSRDHSTNGPSPVPYFQDDRVTLFHGDALAVLPSIASQSAAAMILDPPYSMVPNAVRGRDDGAAGTSGAPMRLLSESAQHARRILKVGGIAPFLCDWRRSPDVSYLITLTGLRIATCVAWTRTTVGTGGMFRGAWDPILVASNGAPDVIDRAAIPNVVTINPPTKRVHPYEKPPGLWTHFLQRIPTASTASVLDPFAGSGASMVAALDRGFRWIGVEIDESYCEAIALRRQAVLDMDFLPEKTTS